MEAFDSQMSEVNPIPAKIDTGLLQLELIHSRQVIYGLFINSRFIGVLFVCPEEDLSRFALFNVISNSVAGRICFCLQ